MLSKNYNVLIVGAGIAGLSAAIALVEKGQTVTILEGAPQLAEIGAGIQVPPNSVKLLKRLGVYDEIAKLATWPRSISFRRWQDGEEIASTPLFPAMEENYGFPYFLIHRGDLHRVLLDRALAVGVTVKTNSYVTNVNEAIPSVTLASGETFTPDLIIGADGIKSQVRKSVLVGEDVKILPDPNCAHRTLIPGDLMLADPLLKPLIESPTAMCWIGHEGHVMSYPIRNGALYNFVMCHPGSVTVGKPNEATSLDEMRDKYKDWDPILTRLINLVPECLKWQNAEIEKLDTWVSQSGKVVLIGDSSHGMVPYMAQGAAMAVEDGVSVAECLARAMSASEIPTLMRHFEKLRLERCYIILDGARRNGDVWHLADGPEQEKRDAQMKLGSTAKVVATASDNPNKWSDPKFQPWMFGHDAVAYANAELDKLTAA